MLQQNKYVIIREDLVQDPVTIISDGLLIGRLLECELLLNHPAVSRTQAGMKEVNGTYYLFNLRPSNPVKLNGKAVEGNEALSPGDTLEVGPFHLDLEHTEDALLIRVSLQIGRVAEEVSVSSPNLGTAKLLPLQSPSESKKAAKTPRAAPLPGDKALDIFWDKRKREAGKMVRPSPLFPKSKRRTGQAQFNWTTTTDLISRRPLPLIIWGAIGIGLISMAAAFGYTSAYAPGPVSQVHTKSKLDLFPAIASKPNGDACTSCHSFTGSMESKCAACHTAEAFVATVTAPHMASGVGCVVCHDEHSGTDFRPAAAALETCAACHNNANTNTYNGRRVRTPHGGTFGYPVVDGKWKWKELSDSEWKLRQISITRLPEEPEDKWRNKQFHSLHIHRVRAVAGMKSNAEGELSCSSCHQTLNPIDRVTPRTTCGACHNGSVQPGTNRELLPSDKPNCYSCHVEHVKDKRPWNPSLMVSTR
jgi:hypothetical protein